MSSQSPITLTKEETWKRLQVIFTVLSRGKAWFTGLPIKRYIKQKIFSSPLFSNAIIASGRWSAYSHFSPLSAFQNLLDKHQIDTHKTILVHPLLPKEFVDELESRKCKIISLDIEKDTLQWDIEKFQNYVRIEQSTGHIDLTIFPMLNGLASEVAAHIHFLEEIGIPSMVFIHSHQLNDEIIQCFSAQTNGSVLISGGQSFIHTHLNVALKNYQLVGQKWYFSWFLESRTQALLEYHLSDSQPIVEKLLNAYFYLLTSQYKTFGFTSQLYSVTANLVALKATFKNSDEAEDSVKESYYRMFNTALPDSFFQLETALPVSNDQTISSLDSSELNKAYNLLASQIETVETGSLEIPAIDFRRPYTALHFFTTDVNAWSANFEKSGFTVSVFPPISSRFVDSEKFPNTHLISNYALLIQLI